MRRRKSAERDCDKRWTFRDPSWDSWTRSREVWKRKHREGIVDKEQSVPPKTVLGGKLANWTSVLHERVWRTSIWWPSVVSVSSSITWLACPLLWLSECRLSFMIEYKIIWILQTLLYVHVQDASQHETVVMAVQWMWLQESLQLWHSCAGKIEIFQAWLN